MILASYSVCLGLPSAGCLFQFLIIEFKDNVNKAPSSLLSPKRKNAEARQISLTFENMDMSRSGWELHKNFDARAQYPEAI